MNQYVSDNIACICLQGIRWMRKVDIEQPTYSTQYHLELQYKGSTLILRYKKQEERDQIFLEIKQKLHGEKKK